MLHRARRQRQALAFVYCEDGPVAVRRPMLTRDGARRIAKAAIATRIASNWASVKDSGGVIWPSRR